jgi:tetratricopeptide (TPR) repeat protein
MHDTADPPITPAPGTNAATASPVPPGRGRRLAGLLLTPLRYLVRRPARTLGLLAFLAGLVMGAVWVGRSLWAASHLRAAREDVARGHNATALRHLREYRQFRPEGREAFLLSARVAWRGAAWSQAEEALDTYGRLYGDDEALVLERQLFRAARGEVEAARPLLQARIEQGGPEGGVALEALGAGLLHRLRWNDTAALLGHWLEREPGNIAALLLLGKLHDQREEPAEAMQTYRQILEADPEHDEARLRLATALLQLSRGDEALAHLEYLRPRLPDNPEVMVQLARALSLQARRDEARALLDQCLRTHPDHAGALAELGLIAGHEGDATAAEEYLGRATRLDPGNLPARFQYYRALNRNNKNAEADQELAAIRQAEADMLRIRELVQGRLQQAPNDPAVHYELGVIALRAGLVEEGVAWLRSALELRPDYARAHEALARYYQLAGNPAMAARHRQEARLGGAAAPAPLGP